MTWVEYAIVRNGVQLAMRLRNGEALTDKERFQLELAERTVEESSK